MNIETTIQKIHKLANFPEVSNFQYKMTLNL